MITRQHAGVTSLAFVRKSSLEEYRKEIPFVLLPDAIRAYSGGRQPSHFEKSPNGDSSWMVFPSEAYTLKNMDKDVYEVLVKSYVPEGFKPCVIGEETDLEKFDTKNYGNKHFHYLRMHLVQDKVLDEILRTKLVDCSQRFEDRFRVIGNPNCDQVIDGATLRKQVALFEKLGFIHLAGKICQATGMVINNLWMAENVLIPLKEQYSTELAYKTFQYMVLDEDDEARIDDRNFTLTEEDKKEFFLSNNLEEVLDEMYAKAYIQTVSEL